MSAAPLGANRPRYFTPKEFSAALATYGIAICPDRIRERCALSSRHGAARIATNTFFKGRHLIPESELDRILNAADAVTA
jgi:hypothetical protein